MHNQPSAGSGLEEGAYSQAVGAYIAWPAVLRVHKSITSARLQIDNVGRRHGGRCMSGALEVRVLCALNCACTQLRMALEVVRQEDLAATEELRRHQEASRAQLQALQSTLTDAQVPAHS